MAWSSLTTEFLTARHSAINTVCSFIIKPISRPVLRLLSNRDAWRRKRLICFVGQTVASKARFLLLGILAVWRPATHHQTVLDTRFLEPVTGFPFGFRGCCLTKLFFGFRQISPQLLG